MKKLFIFLMLSVCAGCLYLIIFFGILSLINLFYETGWYSREEIIFYIKISFGVGVINGALAYLAETSHSLA